MVAPGGQFKAVEKPMPKVATTMPRRAAKSIIERKFFVKVFAIAAGRDKIAITRIAPTVWMSKTTVTAISERSRK